MTTQQIYEVGRCDIQVDVFEVQQYRKPKCCFQILTLQQNIKYMYIVVKFQTEGLESFKTSTKQTNKQTRMANEYFTLNVKC